MDKSTHFDVEALTMLEEIMEDEFPELIRVYIADSDPRLDALQQALADENPGELRELAHSLKGSSANISALPLADLCFQIEDKARQGILTDVDELIIKIRTEYQSVREILNSLVGS